MYLLDQSSEASKLAADFLKDQTEADVLMMYGCIAYDSGYAKDGLQCVATALSYNPTSVDILRDYFPSLTEEESIAALIA